MIECFPYQNIEVVNHKYFSLQSTHQTRVRWQEVSLRKHIYLSAFKWVQSQITLEDGYLFFTLICETEKILLRVFWTNNQRSLGEVLHQPMYFHEN